MARPRVSVVVPFIGGREDAARLAGALTRLRRDQGDEVIVADNTPEGGAGPVLDGRTRVIYATGERSSYHARNAGAGTASGEWLLFMDSDCVPARDLLDAYFAKPIQQECGAVAGEIVGEASQEAFLARYSRDRNFLSHSSGLHSGSGGAATANLLVRRAAFEQLGGFAEGIRSGGDIDFTWRLHAAGWTLEYRPDALVRHRHRESLVPFLAAITRYAAGARWLNRRYPGSARRWPLAHGLVGSAWDITGHLLRGRLEPAAFRAIDALGLVAHNVGYFASNAAPTGPARSS